MIHFPKKKFSFLTPVLIVLAAIPVLALNTKIKSPGPALKTKAPAPAHNLAKSSPTPLEIYQGFSEGIADLPETVFDYAIRGFENLKNQGKLQNDSILTVIDFSKPSTQKRLYVLDMVNLKVLYKTLVAHGRNSGQLIAKQFSNKLQSNMSSLGFYVTGEPYYGEHGYSLKLDGEEKGINDNARKRAIVIHSADYVSSRSISQLGFLGRSFGCPALPPDQSDAIISTIKEGSCLFVYAPNSQYLQKTKLL